MKDKFGQAIGIWKITVGGADIDVKPTMQDARQFRNLLLENSNKKKALFDEFADFMKKLIKERDIEQSTEDNTDKINEYVEFNAMELFNEAMISFRFTTRDKLAEAEKAGTEDLKKLMSSD